MEVAHEELVGGHGEVCPGVFLADGALVEEIEAVRVCLEEKELAALIEGEDAGVIGDEAPVFAEALGSGPAFGSGADVDAGEALVAEEEVGMIPEDDGAGHVALGFERPAFGDGVELVGFGDGVEDGFAAVGTGEQAVFKGLWGEDVHAPERFNFPAPEDRARAGAESGEEVAALGDQLRFAGEGGEDGGGKGAAPHATSVFERPPLDFAGVGVQADDGSAGLDVEGVAVQERGGDKAEGRQRGVELIDEVRPPEFVSVGGVEGDEDIAHAGDEEAAAVGGRGGSDPIAVGFGEEGDGEASFPFVAPEGLAGVAVDGDGGFGAFLAGLGDEHLVSPDHGSGVTFGEGDFPGLMEVGLVEVIGPGRGGGWEDAVAGGAAPLGPVIRRDGCGGGGEEAGHQEAEEDEARGSADVLCGLRLHRISLG